MIAADAQRTHVFLFTILGAGLILRLAAAVLLPDQNFPDAVLYREQARQLWQHFTFDDPYRMPLYQILMALTEPGCGSLALDVLLSTAAIWLSFQLSMALFADAVTALVTAFAMAVYPHFIFYAVVGPAGTFPHCVRSDCVQATGRTHRWFHGLGALGLLGWRRKRKAAAA